MTHVDELLWDWIQGELPQQQDQQVEEHLSQCDACRSQLDREFDTVATFELIRQPEPPFGLRDSVLADATTLARFSRYVDKVAAVADVDASTAEEWLSNLEDEEVWDETALEEMHLFHIDGGPSVENAIVGFVRLQPRSGFPEHTHVGDETIVVLQGTIIDENGERHGPGSVVPRKPGTTHEIFAAPGHPAIYLSVVQEGLEVFGMRFGPDDPQW